MNKEALKLTGIVKTYGGGWLNKEAVVRAVDSVSIHLSPGEVLGIVGESGSGKSTLGRIAAGIELPSAGEVLIEGQPSAKFGSKAWRKERANIQVIWQNPSRALDPRMPIAAQIEETIAAHSPSDREAWKTKTEEMLELVGLGGLGGRYVHQLSGGQQQRAVIARALVLEPHIVICDEAVSALDVSVQAQIINLLNDMKDRFSISYLFISHDLGVVRHISDRIAVMQKGRIVETGNAREIFTAPQHAYTQELLAAAPAPTPAARRARDAQLAANH